MVTVGATRCFQYLNILFMEVGIILYSIDVFSVLLFYFDVVFYSYFHFSVYSFIGVGSMLRIFGSDVLHTWTLGFVEACVGFSLQMIRYIGWSNVDRTYSQSPKILLEIIKKFPAYNSLQRTGERSCKILRYIRVVFGRIIEEG